mmetsp:Transcript_91804/g.259231  ORF Transcript_91804/g.259231 Transcript_91804/m.259231 type:complete len:215 (+) Transcript_91804:1067-1711(+)
MFGFPSVSSKRVLCRRSSSTGSVRRASIAANMPPQMFVCPRGTRRSNKAMQRSRPSLVMAVGGKTTSALSSNATTDKRSWPCKVCITVFTACFTMSSVVKPSLFSAPSTSYVTTLPMEPDMSTQQHTSTGVLSAPRSAPSGGSEGPSGASGMRMLTAILQSPESSPTSVQGATRRTGSQAFCAMDASSSGHSPSSSAMKVLDWPHPGAAPSNRP